MFDGMLKVQPGQEIVLPLILRKDITAGATSLDFTYPSEMLNLKDVRLKNAAFGDNLVFKTEGDHLKIAWYHLQGMSIEQGEPLVILVFTSNNKPLLGNLDIQAESGSEVTDPQGNVFESLLLSLPRLYSDQSTEDFALGQNYPNPFQQTTEIAYYLSEPGLVILRLFNPLGEMVKTLVNENQGAGYHSLEFDGAGLSSGVYPLKLEFKGVTRTFSQYKMMTRTN
jgi:hypothetical protein